MSIPFFLFFRTFFLLSYKKFYFVGMDKENLQNSSSGKNDVSSRKKNFLHEIDIDRLKLETGLSVEEIAGIAELKNPKGVYAWDKKGDKSGTRPSYNALVRLLLKGASVETLFGVEYSPKKVIGSRPMTESDLETVVKKALSDLGYPEPSVLSAIVQGNTLKGRQEP